MRKIKIFILGITLTLTPGVFAQTIYKAIDDQGTVVFSDKPQPNTHNQQIIQLHIPPDQPAKGALPSSGKLPPNNFTVSTVTTDAVTAKNLQRDDADQNVAAAKQELALTTAQWKAEQDQLDNIPVSDDKAVSQHTKQLMLAKQAMDQAKAKLSLAKQNAASAPYI